MSTSIQLSASTPIPSTSKCKYTGIAESSNLIVSVHYAGCSNSHSEKHDQGFFLNLACRSIHSPCVSCAAPSTGTLAACCAIRLHLLRSAVFASNEEARRPHFLARMQQSGPSLWRFTDHLALLSCTSLHRAHFLLQCRTTKRELAPSHGARRGSAAAGAARCCPRRAVQQPPWGGSIHPPKSQSWWELLLPCA